MATCRNCAYLRKCIDKASKGGYEHNVDFDPKDGCPGWGFKSNTAADSNADRIRAMSDEELAKVLNAFTAYFEECNRSSSDVECKDCELHKVCSLHEGNALEWLKQPAEVKDNA